MSKLMGNAVGLVTVGFLPYLINFLLLPFYSLYLEPADFGIIGLAMASLTIASTWTHLQLPGALSRIYFDYDGVEKERFVSTIINGTVLTSLCFGVFYVVLSNAISSLIFKDEAYQELVLVVVVALFFNVVSTSFERLFINEQRGLAILLRSIFCQTVSVAAGIYFITVRELGAFGFVVSQALYYFSMSFFSFVLIRKKYRFEFVLKYYVESLKYSYPLIFHAIGGVVFMYSGVFFIENMLSLAVLGVFVVAEKFSQLVKAVVNSTNNIVMPIYNRLSVVDESAGRQFLEFFIPIWFAVQLLFMVHFSFFSLKFIETYITGDYSGVAIPLFIMCFSYIFRGLYCFASAPLFFKKRTKQIPKITFITGGVSLLLNYLFIKSAGLNGAALAVLAAFMVSFFLAWFFSGEVYRVFFSTKKLLAIGCFILVTNFVPVLYLQELNIYLLALVSLGMVVSTLLIMIMLNFMGLKSDVLQLREEI